MALLLERLRLMDGVSDVTLQSSTKTAGVGQRERRLPRERRPPTRATSHL